MKLIMLISPWIRRLIVFIGMGYVLKISLDDLGLRTREKGIVYARNDGNEGEKGMGINGRWHWFKAIQMPVQDTWPFTATIQS